MFFFRCSSFEVCRSDCAKTQKGRAASNLSYARLSPPKMESKGEKGEEGMRASGGSDFDWFSCHRQNSNKKREGKVASGWKKGRTKVGSK